jgi:hypothetical protein
MGPEGTKGQSWVRFLHGAQLRAQPARILRPLEKIRHATIKMTDYYPLIARAVEELGRSTGEARQSLYERARNAVAQLRSNPALLEADIAKECLALEEAIRKVEAETAGKSQRKHGRSRSRRLQRRALPMTVPKLLPSRRGGTVPIHLRPGRWGQAAPRCFSLPASNC